MACPSYPASDLPSGSRGIPASWWYAPDMEAKIAEFYRRSWWQGPKPTSRQDAIQQLAQYMHANSIGGISACYPAGYAGPQKSAVTASSPSYASYGTFDDAAPSNLPPYLEAQYQANLAIVAAAQKKTSTMHGVLLFLGVSALGAGAWFGFRKSLSADTVKRT